MKRSKLVCALFLAGAVGAWAQQGSKSSQYQGVSNPPPDDQITTPMPPPQPKAKPSPAHPFAPQPAQPSAAPQPVSQPVSVAPAPTYPTADSEYGTDAGIVRVKPQAPAQPAVPSLNERSYASDPDGDIVHPGPLPAGVLGSGTIIRARLLNGLSTTSSQAGDTFRAKVASDVFRGNEILIPQGAEIDGTVVSVSTGHFGGHGSMMLRPEFVILPNGSRFHMYAQVTGAPGSDTDVGSEGKITPGSHLKKDGYEYGGAAGAGAVAGAVVAGPAGALAGSIVGAGAVTVHLLMDHPQATLKSGTVVDFALTEPLNLVAADHTAESAVQQPSVRPALPAADPQPAAAQPAATAQQQIPDIE